jgi:hypothetical protein
MVSESQLPNTKRPVTEHDGALFAWYGPEISSASARVGKNAGRAGRRRHYFGMTPKSFLVFSMRCGSIGVS